VPTQPEVQGVFTQREGHDLKSCQKTLQELRLQPLRLAVHCRRGEEANPSGWKPQVFPERIRHEWNSCPSRLRIVRTPPSISYLSFRAKRIANAIRVVARNLLFRRELDRAFVFYFRARQRKAGPALSEVEGFLCGCAASE
jgi:hypothetical protein